MEVDSKKNCSNPTGLPNMVGGALGFFILGALVMWMGMATQAKFAEQYHPAPNIQYARPEPAPMPKEEPSSSSPTVAEALRLYYDMLSVSHEHLDWALGEIRRLRREAHDHERSCWEFERPVSRRPCKESVRYFPAAGTCGPPACKPATKKSNDLYEGAVVVEKIDDPVAPPEVLELPWKGIPYRRVRN